MAFGGKLLFRRLADLPCGLPAALKKSGNLAAKASFIFRQNERKD
jgi:hypothetical protein